MQAKNTNLLTLNWAVSPNEVKVWESDVVLDEDCEVLS
jgi:hypothetical protein